MGFLSLLGKVEVRALGAVILVAAMVAGAFYIDAARTPQGLMPASSWASLAFFYALFFGAPAALAICAPIYALLSHKNRASWPAVVLLGILPGLGILFTTQWDFAFWFIGCGLVVACLTHVMCKNNFPRLWK